MKKRRIRVLQVIGGFAVEGPRGGVERFGIELAKHLDKTLFDVTVCGLWDYGLAYEQRWLDELHHAGANTLLLASRQATVLRSMMAAWRAFRQQTSVDSFDIIHSHFELGDILCLLDGLRLHRLHRIRTVHNEREWQRQPFLGKFLNLFVLPYFFEIEIGVSREVVRNLNARLSRRLIHRPARLIPNAIDLDRFTQVVRSEHSTQQAKMHLGLPATAPTIGIVGRLDPQKGHIYFVHAAKLILQRVKDAQFVIVGTGQLEAILRQEVRNLGISSHVHFLGARSDVDSILQAFDLLVSSSVWEGLSTTILEGLASGLPIIATRVSGSQDLIDDTCGTLVEPCNPEELAKAAHNLIINPELRRVMGSKSIERAKQFDIRKVSYDYEMLYREMIMS
jgi:glycosyltransferase involved in cell wall biosynthesis